MLVHGYPGDSVQWPSQIAALAPNRDVSAPDLPRFGEEAALAGPKTITGFADTEVAFLDRLGIASFPALIAPCRS